MLTINQLQIQRQHKTILSIHSLTAQAGDNIVILGPNGAGKSSLLKTLASEWAYQQGHIHFHQQELRQWDRRHRARHIGVLPQASQLSFPFSAAEVVAIGATPLTLKQKELAQQVKKWMQLTDTACFADRLYTTLSGGEKQRVQLARVLLQLSQAQQSPLLLLDEPTSAQDLGQQHDILGLLNDLCQQQDFTIISILHDINQASRYADTIWLLHQGDVAADGKAEQILTPERVQHIWGYLPEQVITDQGTTVLI